MNTWTKPCGSNEIVDFALGKGLAFEDAAFEQSAKLEVGHTDSTLWRQPQCLVVPRAWQRAAGFTNAAQNSARLGWPVLTRRSGGGCVFHGPGVLNVTEISVSALENRSNASLYQAFCERIISALQQLTAGEFSVGQLPATPCDGAYNILLNGRKLVGTAMRRRRLRDKEITLAHACIWIDADLTEAIARIIELETAVKGVAPYQASALATLADGAEAGQMAERFAGIWYET